MPDNNLRSLADIVDDLWGMTKPSPTPAPAPAQPVYQSTFPPFEQLWKTADDTVDWTDALAHDQPTDGLTSAHLWQFFHQHAAQVLSGDIAAYVEVLNAANPLGDLSPYATSFDVEAESADRVRVGFGVHPAYMDKDEAEVRRYLCAVALRSARDVMALLPVRQVEVAAQQNGHALMQVLFDRGELQKVRFSFIDPVAFVTACGAAFTREKQQ